MKRVHIAACIAVVMLVLIALLTHQVQRMGDHMTALSQEIIVQAAQGADPEQLAAVLAELSLQWESYERMTIFLAGRNHADTVNLALARAMTYPLTQEDEDLIASLTELICNIRSICITERFAIENFT